MNPPSWGLMQAARAEAELSWREGGIPVGAVLATEDGTIVARGHNQCSGTAVLLGFLRALIGERRSYQGAESWLEQAGIAIDCLEDPQCIALMERLQREKPEIGREDFSLPP